MDCAITIRVQRDDFDVNAEIAKVRALADTGAIVTFSGVCRSDHGRLSALELEHYPGMAEREIGAIAREAALRWQLSAITVIHRTGTIAVGDNIVLVVTGSMHRQAAVEAAS
jgi:molybdopterin synthase catalytic subunit